MVEVIQGILRSIYEDDGIVADPQFDVREHPRWDSFNHINMMIALEQAFGVVIPPRDAEKMRTVADIVAVLKQRGVSL